MSNSSPSLINDNNKDKTVTFDVGGSIYKVSRSLLEQHSDTMLARLASDTWNPKQQYSNQNAKNDTNNNNISDDTLFIERDGERFKYCLDYMRDAGVVALPFNIPKDALIQDLTYYGFQDIDSSKITIVGSAQSLKDIVEYIDLYRKELATESEQLKTKYEICELAKFCIDDFKNNTELKIDLYYLESVLSASRLSVPYDIISEDASTFNIFLEKVGLKFKEFEHGRLYASGGNYEQCNYIHLDFLKHF